MMHIRGLYRLSILRSPRSSASSPDSLLAAVTTTHRCFIEHATDPKQWRSCEKDDIQRQFRRCSGGSCGVPLGSANINPEEMDKRFMDLSNRTNWDHVTYVSVGIAAFVIALNALVDAICVPEDPDGGERYSLASNRATAVSIHNGNK